MPVRGLRRWMAALVALVLCVGLAGVVGGMPAQAAIPAVDSATGQFYGVRGRVANALKLGRGEDATVDVTGVAGVPASGVTSVALNIAAKGLSWPDKLIVHPSGTSVPDPSLETTIIRQDNIYLQNLVMAKVGADGKIKIYNHGEGVVTVYADVHGYTLGTAGAWPGSTYVPLRPARIASAVSIPANGNYTLALLGQGGIPSSGVSHAALTLVAKDADAGKLTVYPSGEAKPADTNLDYGLNVFLQNQVFAKPGADGKVIINNAGSTSVTVWVDASGYFATPQAAVAGSTFQPITVKSLVNRRSLAAGATYTLDPLPALGLTASQATGVSINLKTTGTGNSSGALRIFPSGSPIPGTHTVSYGPGQYSGGLNAKLGPDGKLNIYNGGSATVEFDVMAHGYYKTPLSGCPQAPVDTSPPSPVVVSQSEQFSPTSAMQATPIQGASLGTLEYAYVDNIGQLVHGHQTDPGSFDSVQWTVISGNEAFTGRPGLAEQGDGRLQVAARSITGTGWALTQATKDPAQWGTWANAGGGLGSRLTLARHDDTLVAFGVGSDGGLWALPQFGANDPYKSWIGLGLTGLSSSATTAPVAVPVAGGIQVFALDTSGAWRTALYAHGTLSGCATISESGFSGAPSVVFYPGNKLRIFVRASDGRILTKIQDSGGAFPSTWDQVGTFTAEGSPAALISPGSGRVEIVARGTDNKIYSTGETVQGSGQWRDWVPAQPDGDPYVPVTDPTIIKYTGTNGPAWAYLFRTSANQTRIYTASEAGLRVSGGKSAPPSFAAHTLPKPPRTR